MKLELTTKIKSIEGEVLTDKNKEVTLGHVLVESLMANYNNEILTGQEKFQRYELAVKVHPTMKVADITVEEAALLKDLVGKAYGPAVVGPVYGLFEGKK